MKTTTSNMNYITLDGFFQKAQDKPNPESIPEKPNLYNVKAFYYVDNTQYRIYSRPIRRKSEEEKMMEKCLNPIEKRKYILANSAHMEYCPFTGEMEDFSMTFEEYERSREVSLNRSKQNLIGICRANRWDYFITFTFNPRLVDSSNYEEVCKKAGVWLNNLRKRKCPNMKYVLVPELHKNGEHYHLHGLLANCSGLSMCVSGHTDRKGNIIYNIPSWKYGWNTATEVSHSGKVSTYISKYITKDTNGLLHGRRRYWASHNTVLPEEVCEEYYIPDHLNMIEHLSVNGSIKFLKKSHIMQCKRDIWYIET